MLRLCSESSCSYPGRPVRHAAFDVSFYHSVKLPAGATGLPSPGDIVRSIPPDRKTKQRGAIQDW